MELHREVPKKLGHFQRRSRISLYWEMITIKQIRGMRDYFKNYLSQNEYYSEGEKIVGRWRGKLAKMLGIEGHVVTTQNFAALAENKHPITGEKLRPRSSKVKFHDVVVSAPKSYSVAALVGKDERLIHGFHRAVEKTFGKLESHIAVRDRAGNAYHTENFITTGNGAAAVFLHDDNRLLDPQLHMHLVFSNHSFSSERDGHLALQPKMMMEEAKRRITDQFHRELAKEAVKLGYKAELPDNRLRLSDIGLKLEYKFSKRAQHRRKFENRYRNMFGQKPDKKRVEHFIKDGKAAASKRFQNEYQRVFGKSPSKEAVEKFVVDWRTQKKENLGDLTKYSYQRSQLTSHDAKKLDEVVRTARKVEKERQQIKADEKIENNQVPETLDKSSNEGIQETASSSKGEEGYVERKSVQKVRRVRKKNPKMRRINQQAVGRTEAIRRMRRGMAITQALRGHPMVFMLQNISQLAQQRQRRWR